MGAVSGALLSVYSLLPLLSWAQTEQCDAAESAAWLWESRLRFRDLWEDLQKRQLLWILSEFDGKPLLQRKPWSGKLSQNDRISRSVQKTQQDHLLRCMLLSCCCHVGMNVMSFQAIPKKWDHEES